MPISQILPEKKEATLNSYSVMVSQNFHTRDFWFLTIAANGNPQKSQMDTSSSLSATIWNLAIIS